MELKTPLFDIHRTSGGKIVPFAGYLLPVQYEEGLIFEHNSVRTKAGLFDVSHMGEVTLTGKDALDNVQRLLTNDCATMQEGQVRYSPMCNEEGGIVDDLLVYKMEEGRYMLVINAANRKKDIDWIKARLLGEVQFKDISDELAQIALQGPASQAIMLSLGAPEDLPEKYYYFTEKAAVGGVPCLISRTGYTGEDGFEFYCRPEDAPKLWHKLLEAGRDFGLIPCGLGARDTLRLEAGMPLYGHEMAEDITPLEADLGYFVKMEQKDFIGKKALIEMGLPKKKRVGLKLIDRGIARENALVFADHHEIGRVTSGTFAPHLGYAIAMALLDQEHQAVGTVVEIDVRGRRLSAEVVKLPFYKKK